jgi:hypothetical protein
MLLLVFSSFLKKYNQSLAINKEDFCKAVITAYFLRKQTC